MHDRQIDIDSTRAFRLILSQLDKNHDVYNMTLAECASANDLRGVIHILTNAFEVAIGKQVSPEEHYAAFQRGLTFKLDELAET